MNQLAKLGMNWLSILALVVLVACSGGSSKSRGGAKPSATAKKGDNAKATSNGSDTPKAEDDPEPGSAGGDNGPGTGPSDGTGGGTDTGPVIGTGNGGGSAEGGDGTADPNLPKGPKSCLGELPLGSFGKKKICYDLLLPDLLESHSKGASKCDALMKEGMDTPTCTDKGEIESDCLFTIGTQELARLYFLEDDLSSGFLSFFIGTAYEEVCDSIGEKIGNGVTIEYNEH